MATTKSDTKAEGVPAASTAPSLPVKSRRSGGKPSLVKTGRITRSELVDEALRMAGTSREKLGADVIRKINDKLEAQTTKFFSYQGKVVDQVDVEDHGTQLQAMRLATEILDILGSRSSEAPAAPSFVFVFPTWAKPAGPELHSPAPGGGGDPRTPTAEQAIDVPDDDLEVL